MSDLAAQLRRRLEDRAGGRCEYCRLAQQGQEAIFHIDHIIPRAAGGATVAENLAVACVSCSLRKAARRSAPDPLTGRRVVLFHPRRQLWSRHFEWRGVTVVGRTPTGRSTITALQMNRALILAIRGEEATRGAPPTATISLQSTAPSRQIPLMGPTPSSGDSGGKPMASHDDRRDRVDVHLLGSKIFCHHGLRPDTASWHAARTSSSGETAMKVSQLEGATQGGMIGITSLQRDEKGNYWVNIDAPVFRDVVWKQYPLQIRRHATPGEHEFEICPNWCRRLHPGWHIDGHYESRPKTVGPAWARVAIVNEPFWEGPPGDSR